jgi:hypothetical protein
LKPVDTFVIDLKLPHIMKDALKSYYKKQADQTAMSVVATIYHNIIKELERLIKLLCQL